MKPTLQSDSEKESGIRSIALPVAGRVARLKDGRVGRFGWKSHAATLREFVMQACANEIGLEVPGFPRAIPPWKKDYKAPGLDLSQEQCNLLVDFVSSLPRPTIRRAETPQYEVEIVAGKKLFASIGCAACHRPDLGEVRGIYSDLLLHDMGQSLSDSGNYVVLSPQTASDDKPQLRQTDFYGSKNHRVASPKFGAGTREWRTPPLWGARDSAPYLHDGRADTIVDAISLHDGEGLTASRAFRKLSVREQQQIELFLQSLAAPEGS